MDDSFGGLFSDRQQADQAYAALRQAGFSGDGISMWVHRADVPMKSGRRPSIVAIGVSAAIGAVVAGLIAAILGFLISLGGLDVPGFRPDFARGPYVESVAFGLFIAQGAITGAILGVAIRLASSGQKVGITAAGINHGGVLLVVKADQDRQDIAKRVMIQNGARDVDNLTKKWDSTVWAGFKEVQSSAVE